MISFAAGFAVVMLLYLLIWLRGYRARRQFENKLTSNQLAALRAHISLGGSWQDYREELRRARAHAKAEREALRNRKAALTQLENECAQAILRSVDIPNSVDSGDSAVSKEIPQARESAPPLQPSA